MTATVVIYFWRLKGTMPVDVDSLGLGYPLALVVGAVAGGYGFGSLNLILTGVDQYGRSIVGALAGAITAVEIFKWRQGIRSSTGLIFVPGFCTSLVVGRLGSIETRDRRRRHDAILVAAAARAKPNRIKSILQELAK